MLAFIHTRRAISPPKKEGGTMLVPPILLQIAYLTCRFRSAQRSADCPLRCP